MITKVGYKDAFKPVTTDGNTAVVMWAYQPILANNDDDTLMAKWKVEFFNYKPTFESVKDMILSYYNSKIDEKILSGMEWNGMKVWLSSENQFNYKAAYDIAVQTNGSNLPVVFKFGDVDKPQYHMFKTLDELSDFYLKTVEFIQTTLFNGWKEKDAMVR